MPAMDTGLGVKGVVMRGGEFLVLFKPSGEYDLPGGRLEKGEVDQECLLREIREETGIENVEVSDHFSSWSFRKKSGLNIKGTTWVCHFNGGPISLSKEHSGYTWEPLNLLRYLGICHKYGLDNLHL